MDPIYRKINGPERSPLRHRRETPPAIREILGIKTMPEITRAFVNFQS
jgi:hypothetical protein